MGKDISEIDVNFKVNTKIDKADIKFYDIDKAPFKIYGIFRENGKYRRMPEAVAKTVSNGVYDLHSQTAGGRVRFKTNSPYVAINVKLGNMGKMPFFAFSGSIGFDLYGRIEDDERYMGTFIPPCDVDGEFESVVELFSDDMREITINFPLYSEVKEVYIGISDKAVLEEARPYKLEKPIVYYGSSITQGGCASRPGSSYESLLSRRFDADYVNLGFSGSALAEPEIIEYIKGLDMSMFVFDYDHNSSTPETLADTHEKSFKIIRQAHPDIPIIMMSRPNYYLDEQDIKRVQVIDTTYKNALASGDNNVYFLDGPTLMEFAQGEGSVDNTHPNDLGFASMARAVGKVMEEIFNK